MMNTSQIETRKAKRREFGHVYFITDGAAMKIGFSLWPSSRLDGLQQAQHAPLRLVAQFAGSHRDEQAVLAKFRHLQIRGEWFRLSTEIDEFIALLESGRRLFDTHQATIRDAVSGRMTEILREQALAVNYRSMLREMSAWVEQQQRDGWPSPEVKRAAEYLLCHLKMYAHNKRVPDALMPGFIEATEAFKSASHARCEASPMISTGCSVMEPARSRVETYGEAKC